MKVALIVGHSVKDGGAVNANGMSEYLFNDQLARKVAPLLVAMGHEPLIVYRDCSYSKLPAKVNATGASLALSLHCNAFNTEASGSEVLHYYKSKNGERLAGLIQSEVVKVMQLPDRGLRPVNTAHEGKKGDKGGWLCAKTMMPTVIIEPLFIDNDYDLARGKSRMVELAQAIVKGVVKYE